MEPKAVTTTAWPRWTKAIFALSLVLNLIFIGLIGGAFVRGSKEGFALRDGFGPYGIALSRSERRDFGAFMRDKAQERRGNSPDGGPEMQAFADALLTEPFDREAFSAAISANSDKAIQRLERTNALMTEYFASLTPEQRQRMAKRVLDHLK